MHMWQDEGFNTFINTFSEARRYPEKGDQMARALGEREYVEGAMKQNVDGPIEVNPDRINPALLGLEAYVKPSVGLQLLRQEIMGPAAFDDAFRTYARRWMFKHPTPADFFRTMEDVGGRRLDWFWREWFLENPHFDQAIDTVVTKVTGDTMDVAVAIHHRDVHGIAGDVWQPRPRRASHPRALHVQRWIGRELRLSRRGVEHEHDALR